MPSKVKEACAWGSLALGLHFTCRQGQFHAHRVQWLQDFAKLHKSDAQALASDVKKLTVQQMENKETAFQLLRQTYANLAEMQKERDLLRWKLLQALGFPRLAPCPVSPPHPLPPFPSSEQVSTLSTSLQELGSPREQVEGGASEKGEEGGRCFYCHRCRRRRKTGEGCGGGRGRKGAGWRPPAGSWSCGAEIITPLVGRGREVSGLWKQPCFISLRP